MEDEERRHLGHIQKEGEEEEKRGQQADDDEEEDSGKEDKMEVEEHKWRKGQKGNDGRMWKGMVIGIEGMMDDGTMNWGEERGENEQYKQSEGKRDNGNDWV